MRAECPICGKLAYETKDPIRLEPHCDIPLYFARYRCWCGWQWADGNQRRRNHRIYLNSR